MEGGGGGGEEMNITGFVIVDASKYRDLVKKAPGAIRWITQYKCKSRANSEPR